LDAILIIICRRIQIDRDRTLKAQQKRDRDAPGNGRKTSDPADDAAYNRLVAE